MTNGPTLGGTVAFHDNGTPFDSSNDFSTHTPMTGVSGTDTFEYVIRDALGKQSPGHGDDRGLKAGRSGSGPAVAIARGILVGLKGICEERSRRVVCLLLDSASAKLPSRQRARW